MKKLLYDYSSRRPWYMNLLYCFISLVGMFLIPTLFYVMIIKIIKNDTVAKMLANVLFIGVLYLMYSFDLNAEFRLYFRNFKQRFKSDIKIYLIGFAGMVVCNLLIILFLKEISSNESQVREMLYNHIFTSMISISIIAPIMEELIFRKSLRPIINNKWIYVVVCGLLFGGAHIMTNILNNDFVWLDLFYILPYASLGGSFAYMDYESKTTFSSIIMHAFHNTCTAILLLIVYFGGK